MPSDSERLRPQTPYRGFSPGPHWETSLPKTPLLWSLKKSLNYTMISEVEAETIRYIDYIRDVSGTYNL